MSKSLNIPNMMEVKKKRKLKGFEVVLSRWIEMNDTYFTVSDRDAACWYTEATCTSFLSTAFWSAEIEPQFVALKEFQHEKRISGDKERKWGRADLYVCNDKLSYICEVKRKEFRIRNHRNFKRAFKNRLEPAKKDLDLSWDESWGDDGVNYGLAITFVYLWDRPGEQNPKDCHKFNLCLKNSEDVDAWATWYIREPEIYDNVAPVGMAVIIKVVKP